jgi:putative transcription factor
MPNCDMCGEEMEYPLVASIEGVELAVCNKCAKFGEVIRKTRPRVKEEKAKKDFIRNVPQREKVIQIIGEDYTKKIREAREKLSLKQEEFAKIVGEKTSLIQHIESGKTKPSIDLARKIEKSLHIRLIEQYEEKHEQIKGDSSEGFTLGDFIKVKK